MRLIIVLLILICGCSKQEDSKIVTIEDNNGFFKFKEGTTVVVKLRVNPPRKWEFYGATFYSTKKVYISKSVRLPGQIPGDSEYDVFYVTIKYPVSLTFRCINDEKIEQEFEITLRSD